MFDESGNDAESTRCSDTGKSPEEVSSDSAIVRPNLRTRMSRPAQVLNFWAHYKFIVLLTPVRVAIVGEKSPFQCAGLNRLEAEEEEASRERTSDPLGPEFCVGYREVHDEA